MEKPTASGLPAMEKDVEIAIRTLSAKVGDIKESLSAFVGKMEHEALTWPSVLDSFAALSGQCSTLMKHLNHEKIPPLQGQIAVPQLLSSDRDADLERTTEGRVPILHHEVVPNYLRTKLDLDLEGRQQELYAEAAKPPQGIQEAVSKYNALINTMLSLVDEAKERREKHGSFKDSIQPMSSDETRKLVAAYLHGTGLQSLSTNRQVSLTGRMQSQVQQQQARTISKVPHPSTAGSPGMRPNVPGSQLGPLPLPSNLNLSPYKTR